MIKSLLGFLLTPYMLYHLGLNEYGLIVATQLLMIGGYLNIMELGFQASVVKYTAEYHALDQKREMMEMINTMLLILFVIGITCMGIGLLLRDTLINSIFSVPDEYILSFTGLVTLIAISYLFQFPNIIFLGIYEGLQRFDILKGVETGLAIVNAIGIFIIIFLGYRYDVVFAYTLTVQLIQFLIYFGCAFWIVPNFSLGIKYISYSRLKAISTFSIYMFLGKLAGMLFKHIDRILLSMMSMQMLSFYEVLVKLPYFLKQALGLLNVAVMSLSSELAAKTDKRRLTDLFLRGMSFNYCLTIPILTAAAYFSRDFLYVWVGDDFTHLEPILQVLLIWLFLTPFQTYGISILSGMNRQLKYLTIISYTMIAIKFGTSIWLIKEYELWAVTFGNIASIAFVLPAMVIIYKKELELPFFKFMWEITKIAGLVAVPFGLTYLFELGVDSTNLMLFLAKGGVWCLVYWAMLYFVVLGDANRAVVNETFLKPILRRLPAKS